MADIRYQFVSTGANAVLRDWQSLTSAAQRYAAEINKLHKAEGAVLYGGGGGGGLGAGAPMARRGGGGGGGSAERAAERAAERNRAYLARIRDKHFADEQRSEERAANRSAKVAEQAAAKKVKAEEQALRRIERLHTAAQAKELKGAERNQAYLAKLRDKHFADEQRADQRRQAQAERSRIAEMKKSAASRAWMRPEGFAGSIFRGVGGAAVGLGAAGIGIAVQATRDAMRTQELANRVSINARKSGQDFIDPTMLRKEWEKTAAQSPGQTAEGVGGAVQKFITMTGDIDTARKGQGVFATVASATGADIGDIAEVAASLSQHFDVKGLEEMRDVLSALTFQGKEGAFELKDAASMYQRLAASAAAFGVEKSAKGVKMLGGLTQIARTGTGSGEQAATAIENMFTQLKFKAPKIKAAGVDVYKDGKVRPVEQLIPEIISKVGGTDIAKKQAGLTQIFGEQGIRAINPLVAKYNQTYQETGGTKEQRVAAAMAAVSKEIDKAANAAGTWADVQKDAAKAQTDTSAKMTAAWEKVVAMAGDQIVPALIPLFGELEGLTGIIKPAIQALGLFIRGLGSVVDFLRKVHILDGPTDQEKHDEAKAKLESYTDTLPEGAMGPHSPAVEAKLKELRGAVDATNPFKPVVGANQESFTGFGQFRGALENGGLTPVGPGDAEERAQEVKNLYSAILSDPKGQMDLLKTDPTYMGGMLTDEGRNKALSLASQTKEANDGQGVAPSANLYEAERLAPVFAGLGTAAAQLQKTLEAAAAAGEANLLGGGAS